MSRPVTCSTSKSAHLDRGKVVAQTPKIPSPFAERLAQPVRRLDVWVPESKLIGFYSVDGELNYLPNASRLKYYNPPAEMKVYSDLSRGVHMDLNEGMDVAVRKDVSLGDAGISMMLQWIKLNHERIRAPPETGRWIRPKFVCNRGSLDELLRTSVKSINTWIIYAARWKGTIYLCADKNTTNSNFSEDSLRKFNSWGHKFEQYVLSKSPDDLPDTSKPVIEAEEFRCVYQRNIGRHSVIFCSVMKGVLSNKPLEEPLPFDKLKFIELRTSRIIECGRHETIFNKFKLLQWWTKCYLTNTKHVLCGFRDDTGIVHKLTGYNLEKIIDMGKLHWKPENCVKLCESLLTKIDTTVVRDCDENIYKFEKSLDGQIHASELPASSEHAFLPSSFLEASG